jgi:Fur family ferric uptake transcriptional regulator
MPDQPEQPATANAMDAASAAARAAHERGSGFTKRRWARKTGNRYYRRRLPGYTGGAQHEPSMSTAQDLKTAGLKATLPRLRIINLFETSKLRHMTSEDVYRELQAEGLDIGLATVYRVLTQFEQAGLLVRHHFESGKAVYELNEGKHHDHLVCLQCGRVEEFYDPDIERRQQKIAKERGFAISEHALYLYADCTKPRCPHRKP